ncbi:hypothetical protein E2C01_015059 [Portunus trituberculatus]|uniref:Uncharacterized protein n=1 Tax=Portunus trituberculatus TaxID=210409 RepID=A0A5B7DLY9_PORTR|nr:hypothetical protein [Portunus trituberculatus]
MAHHSSRTMVIAPPPRPLPHETSEGWTGTSFRLSWMSGGLPTNNQQEKGCWWFFKEVREHNYAEAAAGYGELSMGGVSATVPLQHGEVALLAWAIAGSPLWLAEVAGCPLLL